MQRFFIATYAVAVYLFFLATFLYAVAFVGDLPVPKTVDAGGSASPWAAVVIDLLLLTVFAVQHSVMARPAFKRWWTRIVPPAAERSTYVLCASAALVLVFVGWRPLPFPVWQVEHRSGALLLDTIFWAGWACC